MDSGEKPGTCALGAAYVTAVQEAGGIPWPVAYAIGHDRIPQIVDRLDGILFSGGDDLDPALYGQPWHPKAARIDPARQRFELTLLAEVERRRLPTLGICLGAQLLNVYRGGSLIQFLPEQRPDAIEHRKLGVNERRHPVTLAGDSLLAGALSKTHIDVNTSHHQAVDRLGQGLRVIATAPDGVVEGIDDPALPLFVGVQWHPERLAHEPDHLAVFRLLVDQART